jgi:holin-like protein
VLPSLTILLLCQLAGEVIARLFKLPIPGPVVGMMLLFAGLVIRRGIPENLEKTGTTLLSHLSLLFIPAGVGVTVHLKLLADEWLPIVVALIVSTVVTLAVTGLVMQALARGKKP